MLTFATIAELIDTHPAAVWVANDEQSGFIYESEEQMTEHAEMGAAGDPGAPHGAQAFEIEERGELVQALIAAGIDYETQ